jgi:Mn-dependent DtxR family transcriptional regulator
MLQRLSESGHLDYEKYRGVRLTEEGTKAAKNICERHDLLAQFLKMIGVDENTANRDAEGIEHHLQSETLKRLEEFVKIVKKNPELVLHTN